MDEWLKVVLLGIVEGITEFLPISSTGHLIVASEFLVLRDSLRGVFEIFIQFGAVLAVMGFYRAELWQQAQAILRTLARFMRGRRAVTQPDVAAADIQRDQGALWLWITVFVAFLPAAALGLLLDDWITEVLFSPTVVAWSLIIGGVAFIIVENLPALRAQRDAPPEDEPDQALSRVTLRQALIIGLAQTLALVPGTSRSGMSILGGMLAGLGRRTATAFSFYLALPTLGGATLYTLLRQLDRFNSDDLFLLFLGALVSMIVAWLSIAWLLRYIARNSFIPFGYYRIFMGFLILILVGSGVL